MNIRGVSHVGISVSDMDRSITWYRDTLGWEQLFDESFEGPDFEAITGVAAASGRAAGGRIGSMRVELLCLNYTPQKPRSPGWGIGTLTIEVDDAAAAHAEMSATGNTPLGPVVELHGSRLFFILDPDGQPIEFAEYIPGGPAWGGTAA